MLTQAEICGISALAKKIIINPLKNMYMVIFLLVVIIVVVCLYIRFAQNNATGSKFADSCVVDPEKQDTSLLEEYKKQSRGRHFYLELWMQENYEKLCLDFLIVSKVLPEDTLLKDWIQWERLHMFYWGNPLLGLEKLLISIDQEGNPLCEKSLRWYLGVTQGKLDKAIYSVLIQDTRFSRVLEIVKSFK